jgi:hypothetical protein
MTPGGLYILFYFVSGCGGVAGRSWFKSCDHGVIMGLTDYE